MPNKSRINSNNLFIVIHVDAWSKSLSHFICFDFRWIKTSLIWFELDAFLRRIYLNVRRCLLNTFLIKKFNYQFYYKIFQLHIKKSFLAQRSWMSNNHENISWEMTANQHFLFRRKTNSKANYLCTYGSLKHFYRFGLLSICI